MQPLSHKLATFPATHPKPLSCCFSKPHSPKLLSCKLPCPHTAPRHSPSHFPASSRGPPSQPPGLPASPAQKPIQFDIQPSGRAPAPVTSQRLRTQNARREIIAPSLEPHLKTRTLRLRIREKNYRISQAIAASKLLRPLLLTLLLTLYFLLAGSSRYIDPLSSQFSDMILTVHYFAHLSLQSSPQFISSPLNASSKLGHRFILMFWNPPRQVAPMSTLRPACTNADATK